ncbi:hypothetical protein NQ314_012632 [Rhamnusium bicolor]|uniref:RNA-directed DNA polymerase n=1 Tax=Rhamnusium bicolor TaxID=1586634 RepID=A0AAV8XB03_9CUCU|nr:hypothetical protein NQ314_012632 [Rhamnusium bicolor]
MASAELSHVLAPSSTRRYLAEPDHAMDEVVNDERLPPPSERGVALVPLNVLDAHDQPLFNTIKQAQLDDLQCQPLAVQWHQYVGEWGDWAHVRKFIVEDGLLCNIETETKLLLVPETLQPRVISAFHGSKLAEHPGRDETYRQITQRYYWSLGRGSRYAGYRDVIACVEQVCHRWGYPQNIISDGGSQFRSDAWDRFLETHHITHYTSPHYHQRANPVERWNQELKKALRAQMMRNPHSQWDERLTEILFALRRHRNQTIGMSPSEALLGADHTLPGSWQHPAELIPITNDAPVREERIQNALRRQIVFQRDLFPEPHEAPVHFTAGQRVMAQCHIHARTDFGRTWTGPHKITAVLSDGVYELDRDGFTARLHIDNLRSLPTAREPDDVVRAHNADEQESEDSATEDNT